jgi:hypothetical protein
MPPDLLVIGVPLVVVVPALVELAKRAGLPTVWAGFASILACALVLGLVQLQVHPLFGGVAAWALASIVYGLAAAGLYSQVDRLHRN